MRLVPLLLAIGIASCGGPDGTQLFVTDYMSPQVAEIQPMGTSGGDHASIFASPGEYEPVSLVLRPTRSLSSVSVEVTDLASTAGSIPASRISVRVVRPFHGEGRDVLEAPPEDWSVGGGATEFLWATVHVPDDA